MLKRLAAIPLLCMAFVAQAADYEIDPDHTFITFDAEILRSQWGMNFGLPGIPDAVRLLIEVEGILQ